MCGILAISIITRAEININGSLAKIRHRGPDDTGVFISDTGDCHLGHVRLSILDLSPAGHQPMEDLTGRFVITFNGEIYNYEDLRLSLERKYGRIAWRSHSDTEVLIEGFAREGHAFLDKLNGIFAFAIYDKLEKTMHVLRDPLGVKPLYITEQNGGSFICSEIKGLLALENLRKTVRIQSLSEQLAFMYVPEPYTMFNEFLKVTPGEYTVFREGKIISRITLFKHLHNPVDLGSEPEIISLLQTTFAASVRRQLMSDVPVSMMLSGGLDSSSIAYEAVNAGTDVRTAYTISFSKQDSRLDGQSSDLYYAGIVAKKLGISLQVIDAKPEFLSLLPSLVPFLEDGISDPAAINAYLICEQARKDGVKVMLSGQGADEYLCGYRRYVAEQMISRIPAFSRYALSVAGSLIPGNIPGKLNAYSRRIKRLARSAMQKSNDRLAGYYMWNDQARIKSLFLQPDNVLPGSDLKQFFAEKGNVNNLDAMLAADQKYDLMSLNLSYNDKMSMATGVEARVPFLDLELVRLFNSIPVNLKLNGHIQKYILKKAMEPYLPKEIIYREKAGFALPIRAWFSQRNEFTDIYFDKERIRKQGIFEPEGISQLLKDQLSGRIDNSYTIFAILCQQIWLEGNNV